MIKKCKKCLVSKKISQFYSHSQMSDGFLNICIECTKERVRLHRINNHEKVKAYDRKRGSLPHRVEARDRYRKTEAYRISHNNASEKWDEANYFKKIAHSKVSNALKRGALRKKSCKKCGNKNVHAHHEDYNKPLNVVWLCPLHHKDMHRKY